MALLDEIAGHGNAHVAEPDEADLGHAIVLPTIVRSAEVLAGMRGAEYHRRLGPARGNALFTMSGQHFRQASASTGERRLEAFHEAPLGREGFRASAPMMKPLLIVLALLAAAKIAHHEYLFRTSTRR